MQQITKKDGRIHLLNHYFKNMQVNNLKNLQNNEMIQYENFKNHPQLRRKIKVSWSKLKISKQIFGLSDSGSIQSIYWFASGITTFFKFDMSRVSANKKVQHPPSHQISMGCHTSLCVDKRKALFPSFHTSQNFVLTLP